MDKTTELPAPQEWQEHLTPVAAEQEPGWETRHGPGSFGCHELLDRVRLLGDLVRGRCWNSLLTFGYLPRSCQWAFVSPRVSILRFPRPSFQGDGKTLADCALQLDDIAECRELPRPFQHSFSTRIPWRKTCPKVR